MPETERPPKNKKTVRNIVYAFLVFYGSFYVFIAFLDRSVFTHPSLTPKFTAKDFLAMGLSIAVGVVFYRWLAKRNNQKH
jgi:hypothetical protein